MTTLDWLIVFFCAVIAFSALLALLEQLGWIVDEAEDRREN